MMSAAELRPCTLRSTPLLGDVERATGPSQAGAAERSVERRDRALRLAGCA